MRIQVLGPVCAWRDGTRLDLGSPQRRAVLALLAVSRGQQLPFFGIADALWGERPPATASNVVQTHIKHLRHLLEPDRPPRARSAVLPRLGDGYALRVPHGAIDLLRFRALVAGAVTVRRDGRGGGQERAAALLTEALGLWQQPPLADLPFLSAHPMVVALAEEHRGAVAQYGEAMIAAGRSADALPVLEEAAVAQPLDEDAQARLIRAYEAVGRRDQAVAVYRRSRRRLADELGVDPGPALAEAYAALLRRRPRPSAPGGGHDTAGAAELAAQVPAHVPPYPPSAHRLPAQLPADVPDFAGRDPELSALDRLLAAAADSPTAGAVSVVSGTAGVGKTALAVHWAHRTRHRFPDGQLYVNLRGYDPERPMPPGDALTRFLTVLGVPGDAVPLDVDDRASRFRTELADRRMLVVLDNALSEEQVRPLLPGSPACSVVVTSRDSLTGLVALHGARRIALGPLPPPDAVALLRTLVGARVDAEPGPAAALAEQCARLPLALRVAAELAVAHPSSRLADLVAELADQQRRLDLLDAGGDRRAAVEAVFSWSYERLPAPAARTFRLLSLHPGPEADAHAVAALIGEAPGESPSLVPGGDPTRVPGETPTRLPGEEPSRAPSPTRDERPGHLPGASPGQAPGSAPGEDPTHAPGWEPTRVPGEEPAHAPGAKPTRVPGKQPTHAPGPTREERPRHLPGASPGQTPTRVPGGEPTHATGEKRDERPGHLPGASPGQAPGSAPGEDPTHAPGWEPTRVPGEEPAHAPGAKPTRVPGKQPTHAPGPTREERPRHLPGASPGQTPTRVPGGEPTHATGEKRDERPGHLPGASPGQAPGSAPREDPTHTPGEEPTRVPVEEPTRVPVEEPTHAPGPTPDERPGHVPGASPGQAPGSAPHHTPHHTPEHPPVRTPGPTPGPTSGPTPGPMSARASDVVPVGEPSDASESPGHAAGTLALLARAHLLEPARPGRFGTHDLLRAYAFRLTRTHDSEADRQAALVRLFDHYLGTAAAAMDTLYPAERHHRPAVAPSDHAPPVAGDANAARAWLDAERPTLAAVCAVAADRGSPGHAVRLAALLFRHLDSGHHTEALEIHRHALRAAETIGDLGGQAHALTNLGVVHWRLADAGSAEDHLVRALELHHRTGDLAGRARTLSNLGNVHWRLGSLRDAAHDHQQALALYRETGDQVGQARTLTNLGNVCLRLGEYGQAADHQRQALALHDLTGDRIGRARTLSHLGNALLRLGRSEAAAECQEQALTLFRQLGHHGGEAYALSGLGDIRLGQGEFEAAVTCQRQALELFREHGEGYGEASALNGLAEALYGSGRHDEALDHHSTAVTVAAVTGEHDQLARAHAGAERARRALGPWVAAAASSTTSGP
ncbi:tetratricopeptide repeat protein [Streptomyces sp. NPDC058697]|uniref:tetratricopeptide repeat protein n=1 Tax=Streptomyces sp. NPDC058697 TaxID=3346605 RepID=UPI00364DDA45